MKCDILILWLFRYQPTSASSSSTNNASYIGNIDHPRERNNWTIYSALFSLSLSLSLSHISVLYRLNIFSLPSLYSLSSLLSFSSLLSIVFAFLSHRPFHLIAFYSSLSSPLSYQLSLSLSLSLLLYISLPGATLQIPLFQRSLFTTTKYTSILSPNSIHFTHVFTLMVALYAPATCERNIMMASVLYLGLLYILYVRVIPALISPDCYRIQEKPE